MLENKKNSNKLLQLYLTITWYKKHQTWMPSQMNGSRVCSNDTPLLSRENKVRLQRWSLELNRETIQVPSLLSGFDSAGYHGVHVPNSALFMRKMIELCCSCLRLNNNKSKRLSLKSRHVFPCHLQSYATLSGMVSLDQWKFSNRKFFVIHCFHWSLFNNKWLNYN